MEYLYDEEERAWGGVYRAPASSTSPTYFSIVSNDHGDVLALCDADGDAFASYRYDAWGSPLGSSTQATTLVTSTLAAEIASRQILRYAGYAWDAESGFYYCSARYYDPATRQWTTGDPAKADGEESAYQYCGGDCVGRIDASGLWAERYIFGVNNDYGFSVNMRWPFRYKWYCQAFAADLIWHKGSKWRWSYKGMGQHRIAVELYAHAVAYYSAAALSRLGIRSGQIAELRRHASPATVNNNERWWAVPLFYLVWSRVRG